MKVLLVHDYGTASGGAENLSLSMRTLLRQRGHQARLLSSSARPLPLDVEADVQCYGTMTGARRILQACNPMALWSLSRELDRFQPDIVHVRMFMTQLSPSILPLLESRPALLHIVNYDLVCPLNTRVLPDGSACSHRQGAICRGTGCLSLAGHARAGLQQWQWQRWRGVFQHIVCNSHRTRELLAENGVATDGVIWNGVPVRDARPALSERRPPCIGFAGRLVEKKGADWLLSAFARVVKRLPNARLLMAGDGPLRETLQARAVALGMAGNIDWLGHLSRESLEQAFRPVWVQVVPSRWEEPFGLVAAEAMMRGSAVIASDGGGLAEQVVDGETGFVVPVDDVEKLTTRLLEVLCDRAVADRFGVAGRKRALAEFSEDRVVDQCVERYEAMLREPAARACS